MSLEKANILLEKINSLHRNILSDGSLSSIEQDLMKSYIRQLYECYMDLQDQPKTTPKPQAAFETEVIRKSATAPKPKDTYKPPRIIEVPDEPIEISIAPEVQPTPKPEQRTPPTPAYTPPAPPRQEVPALKVSNAANDDISELFSMKKAKELSEKLSESPIRDLTKAIALNDKLLFSNELFGGALVTFNEVIRTLNDMPSWSAAEGYLMELARQHNWTSAAKVPAAKPFIKLVRRRFA
ncbi:MAG: hypothetical protein AAGI23_01710 [Bacteroidota bacterium]